MATIKEEAQAYMPPQKTGNKCGRECSDITCIMCGRKLSDYRERLLEAETTNRAIGSIKKVIGNEVFRYDTEK